MLDKNEEEEEDEYAEDDAAFQKKQSSKTNQSKHSQKSQNLKEDPADEPVIDEEQMLDIAEKCFMRIADALLSHQPNPISVRSAFKHSLISDPVNGTQVEALTPLQFLEGVKSLGISDLEEIDVACLMRILTKPDFENAILLQELIIIMENFGIQDQQ